MIKGKIHHIKDNGTIITLWIDTKKGLRPIHFDHRMFQNFYEANTPLKDKEVAYYPRTMKREPYIKVLENDEL
jgi:hypothetical protein